MPWLERLFLRESWGALVQKTPVATLENLKIFSKMGCVGLKRAIHLFNELHLSLPVLCA
jgi:hypothetical protein